MLPGPTPGNPQVFQVQASLSEKVLIGEKYFMIRILDKSYTLAGTPA